MERSYIFDINIFDIYEEIESEFIFFKQEAFNNGLELKLFNNLPQPNRIIETDIVNTLGKAQPAN